MASAGMTGSVGPGRNELASLLLPVQGTTLVLPNEAVAEVISHVQVNPIAGAPAWMRGTIEWRGLALPLVSYERLNGMQVRAAEPVLRVAVINGIGGDERLPFFGLVTSGIPRPIRLQKDELTLREGRKGPADVMLVTGRDIEAVIPNLRLMENMLLRQLHSASSPA